MSDPQKYNPITSILAESQHLTQPEMLDVQYKPDKLFIGIPKETTLQENRVALAPAGVATLTAHGHRVIFESNAGDRAEYPDHYFSEAGAEIVDSKQVVFEADVILKVAPPTLEEIDLMRPGQILISPIHLPLLSQDYIDKLKSKRITALAMEYIKDENGGFPVVHIMSQIAGMSAMLTAAELMTNSGGGKGILLGGVTGVPSAKVVILGSGVVAEYAARVGLGLGVDLRIFDNNIYKLMRLQGRLGLHLNTSTLNPFQLEKELLSAEVVIGAMHSKSGRTPVIVSEEVVTKMKPGSVIVDVSIDQGGCFATSEVTTHKNPTFVKHGVLHYCVPNIASRVARTATIAVSNILTSILLKAGDTGSIQNLIQSDYAIRNGVYTYKGCLTNAYLGKRFGIKSTDLDLLITSSL